MDFVAISIECHIILYTVGTTKNTSGKQKRGCDFAEPPQKLAIKKVEKNKAEAILNFASLFINELIKMTKIQQILVNPQKT